MFRMKEVATMTAFVIVGILVFKAIAGKVGGPLNDVAKKV